MKYELVWHYVDDPAPPVESEPYIHFWFMLRFPEVPPGKGHTANFSFNVLQRPETTEQGISVVRRGFLTSIPFSKTGVQKFVEAAVAKAFEKPRDQALVLLGSQFIHDDADFSAQFASDLIESDILLEMIAAAFADVKRGDGITLHQAVVIDNYGSEDEFVSAGKFATESRWQDVPDSDISTNTSIFNFLDPAGFRYYLPAAMSWAVKNYADDEFECSFFTYLAVLPTVAPREVGRGIGEAFDLNGFIEKHSFTAAQIRVIYRFICFMAIRAEHGMDEDQYAAVKKWRQAAKT